MSRNDSAPASLGSAPGEWARTVIHRKYFPHVDGLRCLAVIPVVFYHLQNSLCPGGFVGVDIFFVISGFLIYGGILEDLRQGTFSIASFYHRRIRRIFPAYFTVVLCTLLAGIALYPWSRLVPLAQTALFSDFFSTNIYFWLDMGYFRPDASGNALLHLWTLGVEEQFYILIPLLSWGIWLLRPALLKPALILFFILSLMLCVEIGKVNSTTAFYILPTRAWELFAGALLADLPQRPRSRLADFYCLLGLVLIVLSFCCISTAKTSGSGGTSVEVLLPFIGSVGFHPFPGYVIFPVIAGSLLLLRFGAEGPVARMLGSPLFVGIGKISYSLYLWHWPIIVFARYIQYDQQSPLDLVAVFGLSLVAAYFSWRFVEMPIRVSKAFTPRIAFASLGYGCACLGLVCILLISTDGLRTMIHPQANVYASRPLPFASDFEKLLPPAPFRPPAYPGIDETYVHRIGATEEKPTFCLVGDSNAGALAPGLDRVADEHHQSGFYIARRIAPFVKPEYHDLPQQLLQWIGANPDVRDVYLVGDWVKAYKILDGTPNLGDKGKIKPVVVDEPTRKMIEDDFRTTAQWFQARGKRVFVFTSVPEYTYSPADLMARSHIIPLHVPIDMTRADYDNRQQTVVQILDELRREGLITVIPLDSALFADGHSIFMAADGTPYYQDGDHLTPDGAYYVSQVIAPLLWPEHPVPNGSGNR